MSAGGRASHGPANGPAQGIAYRPEIDGLRAIAVLAVILCHAGFGWMPGGFLGVDIFFVISGYLITALLVKDLKSGEFSLWKFYERRIRRILPALLLVMLLCVPLAWWMMLPDDLENFGQSLVGTILFVNNVVLMVTTGYFAVQAQFKPLLHTWSLGVEEQYYLVVPLLMWVAWRLGKGRGVVIGIAAVTLLSFAICLVPILFGPRGNFFLITSRAWELGAGSLAVLAEPRLRRLTGPRSSGALALAGLAMAVVPLFLRFHETGPELSTLIPVAGICLILIFGGTRDPAGRLLSSAPFTGIGLISYSAYLFHQPFFAFARLASLEPPTMTVMALLLPPIFLCAWLSWRWVERPFRDRNRVRTRTVLLSTGAASALLLAIGLTFHFTSGLYRNWPELADGSEVARPNANIAYNSAPARFTDVPLPETRERVRILVLGDSFGRDFINMGMESAGFAKAAISIDQQGRCRDLPPRLLQQARRADYIVIAKRLQVTAIPCVRNRITSLRAVTRVPIVVLGRKAFGQNNNAVMLMPREQRLNWRSSPVAEVTETNAALRRMLPPGMFVDVMAMLSDDQGRVRVFTPEGKFISQDHEHLTRSGARYVGGIIFRDPALAQIAQAIENSQISAPASRP